MLQNLSTLTKIPTNDIPHHTYVDYGILVYNIFTFLKDYLRKAEPTV